VAENPESQDRERLLSLLKARLRSRARSIDEAQAHLDELVQAAKDGHPQLVGLDNDVVLVNVDTLFEVFMDLQRPEPWGEYFATAQDGSLDNVDIPMKRYGGRATYTLDTSGGDADADEKLMPDEEFEKEVELLREAEIPLRKYKPPSY
jgi:hypothetical protein